VVEQPHFYPADADIGTQLPGQHARSLTAQILLPSRYPSQEHHHREQTDQGPYKGCYDMFQYLQN